MAAPIARVIRTAMPTATRTGQEAMSIIMTTVTLIPMSMKKPGCTATPMGQANRGWSKSSRICWPRTMPSQQKTAHALQAQGSRP